MAVSIPSSTLEQFTTFGDLLRFLRRRVGLTQSELATIVGYSHTQISRLEQNLRLPDIPTIHARFQSALGLEDEPKVVTRLVELAATVRREDAPARGICPYKGLSYFDETDADLFAGREALTAKLVERVLSLTSSTSPKEERFLAVVGASGSGKSSLVRAGLVAALRWDQASTDWHIQLLTPTAHPLESLATTLAQGTHSSMAIVRLADDLRWDQRGLHKFASENICLETGARLLLVVDQFEELFALCRFEEERAAFMRNLLTASSEPQGPVIVVITLRADFYASCANYPELRQALANSQEYIGAMSDEEIRRAIEEPAQRGRWELEPGLVDLLLHEVGHEPGALPLLSHALFETWQRRRGRMMTLSGYASSGGVRGAIAETAETVFADQLSHEQRAIARKIFLRLTELSDEGSTADTRRRASFDELILKPEEEVDTRAVLKALADARLITTNEDSAEVAHEALIREWPTLRCWLEINRAGLRLHRQMTETAQEWLEGGQTSDLLYRGARLAQAREWVATHQDELNELERQFLTASVEASEREAIEREEGRQRELMSAKALAEAERQSASRLRLRNRVITSMGSIALILAILVGTFGLQSRNEKRVAISRELAAAAINNLEIDPELSMLLALQALDTAYTGEAEDVLHRALQSSRVRITLPGQNSSFFHSVDFSPDGKAIAATSYDWEITVWDSTKEQQTFSMPGTIARFSPNGTRLVTGNGYGEVTIWDVVTWKKLWRIIDRHPEIWDAPDQRIIDANFSPDGKLVVTASGNRSFIVWDTETGKQLFFFQSSVDRNYASVQGVISNRATFSADGRLLITLDTTESGSYMKVWAVDHDWALLNEQPSHALMVISPDDRWLVSWEGRESINDHGIALFDISHETLESFQLSALKPFVISAAHDAPITNFAFSQDGSMLASLDADGMLKLWHLSTRGPQLQMSFSGGISGLGELDFSPDGTRLVTTSSGGTVRVWDITPEGILEWFTLTGQSEYIQHLALTKDGRYFATTSFDGTAKLWELISRKELLTISAHQGPLVDIAFSPDRTLLATAGEDNHVKIWQLDLAEGATSAALLYTLKGGGHSPTHTAIDFSPDGTKLAIGGLFGKAEIWDVKTGQMLISMHAHASGVHELAFSPDGNYLAIAGDSSNAVAKILDVTSGKTVSTFSGHDDPRYPIMGIAFSPNGKHVASGSSDGSLKIWEARTGRELLKLVAHSSVDAVDFSPDGKYLASVSLDGTVRKWDAASGEELVLYRGDGTPLFDVKITPDGKKIIASGAGSIIGYVFDLQETIRLARSRVSRWFTLDECHKYLHQEECPIPPG